LQWLRKNHKMTASKLKILLPGVLIFLTGCLNPFAPELDNGSLSGELITEQKSPEEVLINFKYSYTFKDSLLYAGLLDSAFVFQYFDPEQGPSGLFVSWTRETDLRTTGSLLRTFDIINLEWLNTVYALREGEDEILAKSFRLDLSSADFSFTASGFAIFTFRFNQQDRKWRIVRWVDESQI